MNKLLQFIPHFSRRLVARCAILFQRPVDDAFQRGRRFWALTVERSRRVIRDSVGDGCRTFARERFGARDHLVEHYPKAEDVGAVIHFLSQRLFRRHIADRAHHCA
jgi:hypothetical protein